MVKVGHLKGRMPLVLNGFFGFKHRRRENPMAKEFNIIEALRTDFDNGEVYRYEELSSEGLINGYSRAVEREIRSRRQLGRKLGFEAKCATARVAEMQWCLRYSLSEEQLVTDFLFYKECVENGLPGITVWWRSESSCYQLGLEAHVDHFQEYLDNPIYRNMIDGIIEGQENGEKAVFDEFDDWIGLWATYHYAHQKGLTYDEVEPWLHLRSFTAGGHDRVDVAGTILFLHEAFEGNEECLGRLGCFFDYNLDYLARIIRLFDEERRTAAALMIIDVFEEYEIRILGENIVSGKETWINGSRFTRPVTVSGLIRMLKRLKYEHTAHIPMEQRKGYDEVAGASSVPEEKKLARCFETAFGRAPKAVSLLAFAMQEQHKEEWEVINGFSVKTFAALKEKAGMLAASRIVVRFGKEAGNLLGLDRRVLQNLHRADDVTVAWVLRHRNTAAETLCSIIKVNAIDSASMSLAEAIKRVEKLRSEREMEALERKYGFEFKNQKFPEECSVTDNGSKAFVMQAGDTRMATVGYDTYCCQHLDGAGESAMMYGLLADNAGFWAIEKQHRIIAQAEIWEGTLDKKPVLCFDNIELADDRDFSYIKEVLRCWLKASKHSDIVMGTGCNVLTYGYQDANGVLNQPYCWQVPSPYTDARTGQIVWLKKGGVVA